MSKELEVLREVALAAVVEQRRARRWRLAARIGAVSLVVGFGIMSHLKPDFLSPSPDEHVAVVSVRGDIIENTPTGSTAINKALRKAFKAEESKGVILYINSPGGSTVQAGQVAAEITRLRAIYPDKPLYAVIGDLGASAGYYMASAAERIYADKASLVGSIGVTATSFGYVDVMEKLGVERRAYTSGEHKAFLDQFQPVNEEQAVFWLGVLGEAHQQFIDAVISGRGDRLKQDQEPRLFSGLVWTGEKAKELGLVDDLGSVETVGREEFQLEEVVEYSKAGGSFDAIARKLGASFGTEAVSAAVDKFSGSQTSVIR